MSTQPKGQINQHNYIGRFAPSPTGPLHYGSLIAAVASYLQAKKNNGLWLVRIENIDPPRESASAANDILNILDLYRFEWDHAPLYQSTRLDAYVDAINKLVVQDLIYACSCSRKQIDNTAKETILGKRYPGYCSKKSLDLNTYKYNLRLRACDEFTYFIDTIYGEQNTNICSDIGDFVVFRKHNLPTYSLAVTIDDAYQGITEVVRGYDLLAFTPLQIYLCKKLELPLPNFFHIPIITDKEGKKLSKQTNAEAISMHNCTAMLTQALTDLGQKPPEDLVGENLEQLWAWAIQHWDITKIPKAKTITH